MEKNIQWFKLNPINGVIIEVSKCDIEAYISMKSVNNIKIDINSERPIECRNDIWIINNLTSKEDIANIKQKYSNSLEEWRRITSCVSKKRYYVSNLGRVKVIYVSGKERILSQYSKSGRKKLMVRLPVGNNKFKEEEVHRLVATFFILNPENLSCVYHKNGDINNNKTMNLEWISRYKLGQITGGLSKALPVLKKDKNTGEVLDWYESMAEAGRYNYLHRETIRMATCGDLKTAGGFVWEIDKEFKKDKDTLREIREIK